MSWTPDGDVKGNIGAGKKGFEKRVSQTIDKAQSDIIHGMHPAYVEYGGVDSLAGGNSPSLVGTGASIFLDQNHANSITPDTRNIVTMSPEATILVKKKVFSSLKSANDLRFMDKTEKMLLRATKALFAYKVQQIRAYEALTKFENFFSETGQYSLNLLSSVLRETSRLDLSKLGYTESEYVEKRLNAWYLEEISVYQSKDGRGSTSWITVDPNLGESAVSSGVSPQAMTNLAFLKTLPSSSAKDIVKKKKAKFKAEYKDIDSPYDIEEESHKKLDDKMGSVDGVSDFFEDLGTMITGSAGLETYDAISEDILKLIKRNAFSVDNQLTTWIVDPDAPENYILGPGTGVIEIALFNSFNTTINYSTSPSNSSFSLSYPYRLGTVLEDDIEMAINEALNGTVGIFQDMMNGGLTANSPGETPPIDASSVVSAAFETAGLGGLDGSLDMDYVRERLRTFYLGKSFINPPDPVHIYVRGNRTLTDNTGVGLSAVEPSGFDKEYLEIDESILKAEYQLYTSQAISYELFKEIRKRQDNSFGMVHVFGGFITSVKESFNGGFWDLSATCTDNMSWLEWSQFAISPSLSDPKNILEDPLTPFSMVKDELGQIVPSERDLLHENKQLLQSGLLSYDSGLFAGQSAGEGNLLQGQYSGVGSLNGKKVIQHADGFVYRWKTGVITATAGFQSVDPTGANVSSSQQHSQSYQVTVAPDVLNNLDVPNILSILIVGQPYNIETFIEQSYAAHNKRDKTASLSPQDPLAGVIEAVRKQNEYFGNFHPYRTNTISPESAERMINTAGMRQTANDTVKKLRKRKIAINKKIRALKRTGSVKPGTIPPNSLALTLQAEVDTIDAAINKQVLIGAEATNAISSADKVGIEIGLFGSSGLPISNDFDENQEITRAMMLVGAQRRIEDVRLNRDRNLLIISDQYDMADVRPFILALKGGKWNLFNSGYSNVLQKCHTATSILNLEFFCNSQGHLEFRPPQWNKTPLTVLKEAIRVQKESGKAVVPSFITNLFQTRIESLRTEVYTSNVEIVLIALMMGRFPDSTLIPNMNKTGEASLAFFGVSGDSGDNTSSSLSLKRKEYSWETGSLTEQNNSIFGEGLKVTASFSESGNSLGGDTETILGDFDPIFQEQTGVTDDVLSAIASGAGKGSGLRPPAQHYAVPSRLNNLRDTFKKLYGRDPAKTLGIDLKKGFEAKDILTLGALKEGDAIEKALESEEGLITKLRKAISKRDSYVSMLVANEKKVRELDEIETFLSTGEEESHETNVNTGEAWIDDSVNWLEGAATNIKNTIDIITGSASEGSVYDHLIADDTRNLLGHGSGKRFILSDEHIHGLSCTEQPPDFTRVDIEGSAPFIASGINSGTDNMYFWAGATDFDLWRQYGYRPQKKNLPFISDVEGQARPYAILELGLQKLKVNRASAQVVGNEFYQPGDTVYIPSKGLLYYVESVGHSFSYAQSFTTSLSLVYGHPPGDYVPGPLDVIGQELVGNMLTEPAIIHRTSNSDDNYRNLKPDTTLVFPSSGAGVAELLSHGDNQVRFMNMMIDVMGALSGSKYLLVRGFVPDENDQDEADRVRKMMKVVRSLFEKPSQIAKSPHGADAMSESLLGRGLSKSLPSWLGGGDGAGGKSMALGPMRLPNNMPITPIRKEKIIEQLTYLKKSSDASSTVGEIKCMDRKLFGALYKDNSSIDVTKATGIFPKGGPRQGSWLDCRDDVLSMSVFGAFGTGGKPSIGIIEVGIINIPNNIMSSEVQG